jgi:hypothetical protein
LRSIRPPSMTSLSWLWECVYTPQFGNPNDKLSRKGTDKKTRIGLKGT